MREQEMENMAERLQELLKECEEKGFKVRVSSLLNEGDEITEAVTSMDYTQITLW